MSEQASMVGALRQSDPDELEAGLNALIERRAANAEHADDAQAREESWKESVRQFHAENREARRHQWVSYYRSLSESFRRRSEECAEKAAALGNPARDPGEGGS